MYIEFERIGLAADKPRADAEEALRERAVSGFLALCAVGFVAALAAAYAVALVVTG